MKTGQKQYIDKVKVISQLAWNVHSQNVKSIFLAIAQCSIFAISLRIIIEILSIFIGLILGILHQEINRVILHIVRVKLLKSNTLHYRKIQSIPLA